MENLQELSDPARELRRRFDELTAPHRRALWQLCLKLTGNVWDAEDLAQESLLRAFGRLSFSWEPIQPRAYLCRIAANTWIDTWRRRGPAVPLDEVEHEPEAAPDMDPLEAREAMKVVVECLSPPQRVAFLLTEAFGFRHEEVAGMLGTSAGAVKALRYRARQALRAGDARTPVAAPVRGRAHAAVLDRYVDAFNRRDVAGIVALLDAEAVNDIVGVAEERGVETMRNNSLAEWVADPMPTRAEIREVFGREVVLVFQEDGQGVEALAWLVDADVRGDRIRAQRLYCFCPEMLEAIGFELGLRVRARGYWYEPARA